MSDYLPREVWEEIFFRLPLRSIVKCTSVCKAWKSIITDHDFISDHLNRTLQANHGNGSLFLHLHRSNAWPLYYHDYKYYLLHSDNQQIEPFSNLKFPLPDQNKFWTLVGTCNGLVCFADYSLFGSTTLIICNPSIRKYVVLPKPKPIVIFSNYRNFSVLLRFGYDSRNKDFKVLRLVTFYNYKETLPQVEVYSLATGSWRSITDRAPPFLRTVDLRSTYQMFVNGALHWVVKRRSNDRIYYSVLSFDVVEETFGELMLPHCLKESHNSAVIDILVGWDLFAVYNSYFKSNRTFFSIWVMKEYGIVKSWIQVLHIDSTGFGGILRALALGSSGEVVLRSYNGTVILLDPMKKLVKKLGFEGFYGSSVGCHVESLFLINKEQGVLSY